MARRQQHWKWKFGFWKHYFMFLPIKSYNRTLFGFSSTIYFPFQCTLLQEQSWAPSFGVAFKKSLKCARKKCWNSPRKTEKYSSFSHHTWPLVCLLNQIFLTNAVLFLLCQACQFLDCPWWSDEKKYTSDIVRDLLINQVSQSSFWPPTVSALIPWYTICVSCPLV